MKIRLFYHSVISDWNHGNAHFLRGLARELQEMGHDVVVYEPEDSWSLANLLHEYGEPALDEFHRRFPEISVVRYSPGFDAEAALEGVDLALVHEWNDPALVKRLGKIRSRRNDLTLLFHDTHHRSATNPQEVKKYELSNYDGVLAFGDVIRDIYLKKGWTQYAWTFHEAADTKIFKPMDGGIIRGDVIWIGNWGDDERTKELKKFLLKPVKALNLSARIYGVRYPEKALQELEKYGIDYRGWLPNYRVPEEFARFRVTVHIPRKPYVKALPGIPTIRPFEAMACGIPLISSPWDDTEGLFEEGRDYLQAKNSREMKKLLLEVLNNQHLAQSLIGNGLRTIRSRHTCRHRAQQLVEIYSEIQLGGKEKSKSGGLFKIFSRKHQ